MRLLQYTPPHDLPRLLEWMERNLYIPSNEGNPGPFRAYPTQREIIEAMDDPTINRVVLKVFSQFGKTLMETGSMLHNICVLKRTSLFAMPSDTKLKDHLNSKLIPLLQACPAATREINFTREGSISLDGISYKPGGWMPFLTPTSKAGFKSISACQMYADEVDEYIGLYDSSNPIDMLVQRAQSYLFWRIIISSTPGIKGQSLVDYEFEKTDQRYYNVPCHVSGDMTRWRFMNGPESITRLNTVHSTKVGEDHLGNDILKWDLVCPDCEEALDEEQRLWAIENGLWVPTNPSVTKSRGYQLSQLYSMTSTIDETFSDYDPTNLLFFMTQRMGESYDAVEINAINPKEADKLFTEYEPDQKPWLRTAAVDTQSGRDARCEYMVCDWYGSYEHPKCRVRKLIRYFKPQEGALDTWPTVFQQIRKQLDIDKVHMCFWDVGTNEGGSMVRNNIKKYLNRRHILGTCVGVKGVPIADSRRWETQPIIINDFRFNDGKVKPDNVAMAVYTDIVKIMWVPQVHRSIADPRNATITFDQRGDFPADFTKQLGSETLTRVQSKTSKTEKLQWIKVGLNEAFDLMGLNWSAMIYYGPKLAVMNPIV